MKVELTTMCAIFREDSVLMINRIKSWKGWAFPGGHLENNESLTECVKREIFEETGIVLEKVVFKGVANIFNTVTGVRHIIFNYCAQYNGNIIKSDTSEGRVTWVKKNHIKEMNLAEGMEYRLPLFLQEGIRELYIEWDSDNGYTRVVYHEV